MRSSCMAEEWREKRELGTIFSTGGHININITVITTLLGPLRTRGRVKLELRSPGWGQGWRWRGGITNAVGQFMSSQVTIPSEHFLALIAFIRFVISMSQQ